MLEAELSASDAFASDLFGGALDMDGSTLIIGARGRDDVGPSSGAAYLFHNLNGTWLETGKLAPTPAVSGSNFGSAISIDGDRVLIGAPRDPVGGIEDRGSASVFDLPEPPDPPDSLTVTVESEVSPVVVGPSGGVFF